MFQRILLASGGRDSWQAAAVVVRMAAALDFGARVEVLHVKECEYETKDGGLTPTESSSIAIELADAVVAALNNQGVSAHSVIRPCHSDDVADDIVAEARSIGADLIVMGSCCRSGLKSWLLGNIANKVIREAPCPVLVAPDPSACRSAASTDEFTDSEDVFGQQRFAS
jgi:nucleotide-binding universal stress UspA family protein